jgi:S-adenosylmethionine uptake transporter
VHDQGVFHVYNHGGTLMVANLQYLGIIFFAVRLRILFGDQIPLAGRYGADHVSAIAATLF